MDRQAQRARLRNRTAAIGTAASSTVWADGDGHAIAEARRNLQSRYPEAVEELLPRTGRVQAGSTKSTTACVTFR